MVVMVAGCDEGCRGHVDGCRSDDLYAAHTLFETHDLSVLVHILVLSNNTSMVVM